MLEHLQTHPMWGGHKIVAMGAGGILFPLTEQNRMILESLKQGASREITNILQELTTAFTDRVPLKGSEMERMKRVVHMDQVFTDIISYVPDLEVRDKAVRLHKILNEKTGLLLGRHPWDDEPLPAPPTRLYHIPEECEVGLPDRHYLILKLISENGRTKRFIYNAVLRDLKSGYIWETYGWSDPQKKEPKIYEVKAQWHGRQVYRGEVFKFGHAGPGEWSVEGSPKIDVTEFPQMPVTLL